MLEILTYNKSLLGEVVSVFNTETAAAELVVKLSPELFERQVAAKSCFSPDGCFLATKRGRALGLAFTSAAVNREGTGASEDRGVIAGLFFPADRLDVGEALVERSVEYLRSRGARTIYGFASAGGYPFWRGLYGGAEPVCLTDYRQAWIAFMSKGFKHHQQSLNYLGLARGFPYREDLEYTEEALDLSSAWARDSWRGHKPKTLVATRDGKRVGTVGWVEMPYMSDHLGYRIAGIYGISVVPEVRRQGMATSLLGRLFELAGQSGIERILVGTTVGNTAARRTYEKAGMKVVAFRTGTMLELA